MAPPDDRLDQDATATGTTTAPAPSRELQDAAVPERAAIATPPAQDNTLPSGLVLSRLQARLTARACATYPEAQRWQRIYARSPERFAAQIESSLPLLAYVLEEIERRDLPGEFALIPIVESGYRPEAIGPGGAAGMWQIMAATGRGEGMVVRGAYDGRLSVHRATEIALDLLEDAQRRFGDWRLAAMAYNAGEYGIARALKRNAAQSHPDGRLTVAGVSKHVHAYVAKLDALSCLLGEPERHGIGLAKDRDVVRLAVVDVPTGLHRLGTVAHALRTDADQLRRWNAGLRHGAFIEGAPRSLLVPMRTRPLWVSLAHAKDTPPPAPRVSTYVVRLGDSLWSIARRHGVRLKELMAWNRLDEGSVLKPGQALRISP